MGAGAEKSEKKGWGKKGGMHVVFDVTGQPIFRKSARGMYRPLEKTNTRSVFWGFFSNGPKGGD